MLINRGKVTDIYISSNVLNSNELKQINKEKRGSPFEYGNAIILASYSLKCILGRGYRQIQGFIENIAKYIANLPKPNFSTGLDLTLDV